MRFKKPDTRVFNSMDDALDYFCLIDMGFCCKKCPLHPLGGCTTYPNTHPVETAEIIGCEIIQEVTENENRA